jgi:hypothetical protein
MAGGGSVILFACGKIYWGLSFLVDVVAIWAKRKRIGASVEADRLGPTPFTTVDYDAKPAIGMQLAVAGAGLVSG